MKRRHVPMLLTPTMLLLLGSGCAWFGPDSKPFEAVKDSRPCYLKIISLADLPYAQILDPRAQIGDILKARWCEDEDHADLVLDALRLSH